MAQELIQRTDLPIAAAAFKDDNKGGTSALLPSNGNLLTTWRGVITNTTPGVITGNTGDNTNFIPGGAVPVALRVFNPLAASTGATITVGIDTTATYFLNGLSVSTLATGQGALYPQTVTNLFAALATMPSGTAHSVTGFYSQTATAPGGGPYYVEIDYYQP